ncbi:MAG: hypothetical protein HRF43_07770 [Phycisphaerae bacterium]|jgi:hypothetical protein
MTFSMPNGGTQDLWLTGIGGGTGDVTVFGQHVCPYDVDAHFYAFNHFTVIDIAGLTADKTTACENEVVTFTATTTPPGYCWRVVWDAGTGQVGYTSPDCCDKKISWGDCGTKTVKARICCHELSTSITVDCQSVVGPDDLWYFGLDPAGANYSPPNDAVQSAFTFARASTGSFDWTCSNDVCIVNGSACGQALSGVDLPIVIVRTRSGSAFLGAWVRCKWTSTSGSGATADCRRIFTVRKPSRLERSGYQSAPFVYGNARGFESYIHYRIRDQFDAVLPYPVPWNEQFTTAPVSDWPNEDWPWGPQMGWTVNPNDAFDTIRRSEEPPILDLHPDPLFPGQGGGPIDHRQGLWRVGSAVIGQGLPVLCCGNSPILTWQIYQDHGDHLCP